MGLITKNNSSLYQAKCELGSIEEAIKEKKYSKKKLSVILKDNLFTIANTSIKITRVLIALLGTALLIYYYYEYMESHSQIKDFLYFSFLATTMFLVPLFFVNTLKKSSLRDDFESFLTFYYLLILPLLLPTIIGGMSLVKLFFLDINSATFLLLSISIFFILISKSLKKFSESLKNLKEPINESDYGALGWTNELLKKIPTEVHSIPIKKVHYVKKFDIESETIILESASIEGDKPFEHEKFNFLYKISFHTSTFYRENIGSISLIDEDMFGGLSTGKYRTIGLNIRIYSIEVFTEIIDTFYKIDKSNDNLSIRLDELDENIENFIEDEKKELSDILINFKSISLTVE